MSQDRVYANIDRLKAANAPHEVIDAYVVSEGFTMALGGYRGWRKPIDHGQSKLSAPQIMAKYKLQSA
jgi:hypothetical protein